jgi:hypothetical protein
MALTPLQRRICRLVADERKRSGESYVAGGGALNEFLAGTRKSRDVDLFHDTEAALVATWAKDRGTLTAAGLIVETIRELPAFVEAQVRDANETVLVQWAQDSAYRFFPLVEHETLGLTLHPFDLATNKLLAVVGRREARDWIDVVHCHDRLQPLGYLAWAAAGKDLGFGPLDIVEEAARSTRYTQGEVDALDFDGPAPNAGELSRRWHKAIAEAREIVRALPEEHAGKCVLDQAGFLVKNAPESLEPELRAGRVTFHEGCIRGAFPELRTGRGPGFER